MRRSEPIEARPAIEDTDVFSDELMIELARARPCGSIRVREE